MPPDEDAAREIQRRRRRFAAIFFGALQVPVLLAAVNPVSEALRRLAAYFLFLEACVVVAVAVPTFAYYKLWRRLSWRESLRETVDSILTAFEGFSWPG